MNAIKSNPFVSALAGITLVVCGVLFYLASSGGSKYEEAKVAFDSSYASVKTSEGIALYPTTENANGKKKALGEYRESITELSNLFDKYRPGPLVNESPQAFSNGLKKANKEVSDALASAKCSLPADFYMGFEDYSKKLANKEATGVLGYELEGIRHALLGLADASPSELIKIHRENLPEENGGSFDVKPNDIAREFSFEITFKGSEESARKFISHLGKTDPHYYVVRTVKIVNERDTPPAVGDAKFERSRPAAAPEAANPFGDFFTLPDNSASPEDGPPSDGAPVDSVAPGEGDAAEPVDAAAPDAAATEVDTSRILYQVLGSEEIIVFVRIDLLMFLPSKELPQP